MYAYASPLIGRNVIGEPLNENLFFFPFLFAAREKWSLREKKNFRKGFSKRMSQKSKEKFTGSSSAPDKQTFLPMTVSLYKSEKTELWCSKRVKARRTVGFFVWTVDSEKYAASLV